MNLKNFFNKYKHIVFMTLSFLLLDIVLRWFTRNINFYKIYWIPPNLFTICWIFLFIGIITSSKENVSKIIYIVTISISLILFLVNSIYFSYFKNFFDFSSLQYAGEASAYLVDAIKSSPIWIFITTFIIITLAFFCFKNIPENKKNNWKQFTIVIVIFIIAHILIPYTLGKTTTDWDAWRNPRNVYNSFNDNNRSMQVSGFYEYCFRNFYTNFIKKEDKVEDENNEFL